MSSESLVLASNELAARIGMEKSMMLDTFKAQCFRNASNVSDSQLAAFVSIAREMGVNPLLPGMLYAYPTTGGGIVPMMGPDGVYKKLMEHPSVDSWTTKVYPEDPAVPPTHATTLIFLKGKDHPIEYTAYLSEWKVSSNPNWGSRPRHMLGLRSLKQAARQVIHGLPYDEDDKTIGDLINVTHTAGSEGSGEKAPVRPEPPKREKRGVAAVAENPKAEPKAVEAVVEVVTEKVETKPEPKKEAAKEVQQDLPVAEKTAHKIEDGKEITIEGLTVTSFTVEDLGPKAGPKTPNSIKAVVEGIEGTVYHLGGNCPAWQTEQPVTLRILGKALKNGSVAAMVQSIEITPVAPADGEIE